jgi:hypothetical protein
MPNPARHSRATTAHARSQSPPSVPHIADDLDRIRRKIEAANAERHPIPQRRITHNALPRPARFTKALPSEFYVHVTSSITAVTGIAFSALFLYCVIITFSRMRNQSCTASLATLAKYSRTCRMTVKRNLKRLTNAGAINVLYRTHPVTGQDVPHEIRILPGWPRSKRDGKRRTT